MLKVAQLSDKEKKKFYKSLDIIDIVFNINTKDYSSIYNRDHVYNIYFNNDKYTFKSKAAVARFQLKINYEYTLIILELNDIFTQVYNLWRKYFYIFSEVEKKEIEQSFSGCEWQFRYFQKNRYSPNYAYYVVVQIKKTKNELLYILSKMTKNQDIQAIMSVALLKWRLEKI